VSVLNLFGAKTKKTVLSVSGLHCGSCVRKVENAIRSVKGVKSASVDLSRNQATVELEEKASLDSIARAVQEAGYSVEKK
jgi:copper chaperone CopZ